MQHEEYDRMHELEDEYWWFVARRSLICSLLSDLPAPKARRILDLGCGTGAMLDQLAAYGDVIGADFAPEALGYCRSRGQSQGRHYRLTRADARTLPIRSDSLDVVTAMDVIEHIDDDKAALGEIARVLRPGGYLLATVPAFQSLWSAHDVALHHFRRYTLPGFRDVVQRSGLEIVKDSYTITALFPAIWAYRTASQIARRCDRRKSREPKADLIPVNPVVNKTLINLCRIESDIVRKTDLPFGTTVVLVARKPLGTSSGISAISNAHSLNGTANG